MSAKIGFCLLALYGKAAVASVFANFADVLARMWDLYSGPTRPARDTLEAQTGRRILSPAT